MPCAFTSSSARARTRSTRRAPSARWQPWMASSLAMAAPKPLDAPVMRTMGCSGRMRTPCLWGGLLVVPVELAEILHYLMEFLRGRQDGGAEMGGAIGLAEARPRHDANARLLQQG